MIEKPRPSLRPIVSFISSSLLSDQHLWDRRLGRLACFLNIEQVHQLSVELMHTEDHHSNLALKRLGRGLEGILLDLDYITDLIDQQAYGAVPGAHHHIHRSYV